MPYRRQRRAATQVMQNLGDGTSPEREGQVRSPRTEAARTYAGRTGRPQRKEGRGWPSNTQANCRNAGNVMAGSNAHTSLQRVRASGEVQQRPRECVGYHGIHRQTRCAVRNVSRQVFPMEKNSNGRISPTYWKPSPPRATSMSSNATRDAARLSVASPAVTSRAAGGAPSRWWAA
jgi:hypothetical protein